MEAEQIKQLIELISLFGGGYVTQLMIARKELKKRDEAHISDLRSSLGISAKTAEEMHENQKEQHRENQQLMRDGFARIESAIRDLRR